MLRPRLLLPLLALGVLGAFLLGDLLVVSDEEAIEALVDDAADAVRRADFAAFRALLADDFAGEGGDVDGAVRRAQRARGQAEGRFRAELLELEIDGDRARGPVKVSGAVFGNAGAVSLDVGFLRTGDGWRIASARILDVSVGLPWGR